MVSAASSQTLRFEMFMASLQLGELVLIRKKSPVNQ